MRFIPSELLESGDSESGFTLVELLVVILIIGILAAIAIPAFLNQQYAAQETPVHADTKNAAVLAETWASEHPNEKLPVIVATPEEVKVNVEGGAPAGVLKDIKVSEGTTLTVLPDETDGEYTLQVNGYDGTITYESDEGITYDSTW